MTFLLLAAAALVNGAIGDEEFRITSVDEFIQFKDNVNSGNNYSGTTVFLDSDMDFTGKTFEQIGKEYSRCFSGTFDGQGHVIRNLEMTSLYEWHVGLFGYSRGLTIKNVILDTSCSITSTFRNYDYANIGGIIGRCESANGPCIIENSVNMGSVTFRGESGGELFLGGIAGYIDSSRHDPIVKNCANYGDVTHSGKSSRSYSGGIVGYSGSLSSDKIMYIHNCFNHGSIAHSGTTSEYLYIGGIVGYSYYTTIENCVSGGKISFFTEAPRNNYIGSIAGEAYLGTSISYTYITSDLSDYKEYGRYSPSKFNILKYDSATFELNDTVSIGSYKGTSLIDALNAAADSYKDSDFSHWLLSKENNAVIFTINRKSTFKMNYPIILLPSLSSEGTMRFIGWYTDDDLTTPLTEFEITDETELYGKYCKKAF